MLVDPVTFIILAPLVAIAGSALAALVGVSFTDRDRRHQVLPWVAAIGLVAALALVLNHALSGNAGLFLGALAIDPARAWILAAIVIAGLCGIAGLQQSLARDRHPGGEGYALICLATIGAILMVEARSTLVLFVGMELASLSVYPLVGLRRREAAAGEALFKYLVMGAAFSGIFLYGAALAYGGSGRLDFGAMPIEGRVGLYLLGHLLMVVGLLFKVSAVPFHFWAPDAYTGAPVAVTGFMAAIMKLGGFTALGSLWLALVTGDARLFSLSDSALVSGGLVVGEIDLLGRVDLVLLCAGVLSLLVGNFSALGQTSLRRLLAYSGIAHAGYLLLALKLGSDGTTGLSLLGLAVYLVGYGVASAGAMACLTVLGERGDGDDIAALAGRARRHPYVAAVFTLLVASLAGLPPTLGFLGKYLVLADLVAKGYVALAVVAMVLAVVGAAAYLHILVTLWQPERDGASETVAARNLNLGVVTIAAIATIVLLVLPYLVSPPAIGAT